MTPAVFLVCTLALPPNYLAQFDLLKAFVRHRYPDAEVMLVQDDQRPKGWTATPLKFMDCSVFFREQALSLPSAGGWHHYSSDRLFYEAIKGRQVVFIPSRVTRDQARSQSESISENGIILFRGTPIWRLRTMMKEMGFVKWPVTWHAFYIFERRSA